MKIVKFGGSSLANGDQILKVIKIVKSDPARRVIVVSAPGKRFSGDRKITDLLLDLAQAVLNREDPQDIYDSIFQRYTQIAAFFQLDPEILTELKTHLFQITQASYPSDVFCQAALSAQGEYMSARLITAVFNQVGLKARMLTPMAIGMTVSKEARNAQILPASYAKIAQTKIADDEIIIFPGFFGITKDGLINTFSRGGSDITGAILARGLNADLYENFTDVDSIYAVNPKLVDNPAPIHEMTFSEMRELSYAGFAVFHDEAILPAIEGNIPINVKNTNHPEAAGTMIVPRARLTHKNKITGIASANHFQALYIHRYLINRQVGFTASILKILADLNISYEHMPSGIDDITIIFDKKQLTGGRKEKLTQRIQEEIHPDALEWKNDYAIIMVVGEGLINRVGAMSDVVDPMRDAGVSLTMVNQGASEISIMLGVKPEDEAKAVRAIYDAHFENGHAKKED
ncbi:MAG: aspartate kinase [Oenococcus sp.]|uniref:aspartate kinase n=1 Tax=Oenococcus sp. TaxID=1979414 RepID=UPI0039E96554